LLILWRRGWIVVLTFLCAVVAAAGVLTFVPGRYDATATASIDPGGLNPVTENIGGNSTAIGLMQGNLIELVESQRVALEVVKRLNLTGSPRVQAEYRASDSFGRKSIDDWMAEAILRNVDAKFQMGTNVLSIRYRTGDPSQAALIANAFLAATVDESITMKAASGDQTARWFAPQIAELHKELEAARGALEAYQAQTNVVAPTAQGGDVETANLNSVTQDLAGSRALLTALQSRLTSGSTELSNDPSDPDLQLLAALKQKATSSQSDIEATKNLLGANNPKMVTAAANLAAVRKQIADATDRMKDHLKERIATTQNQIASLQVTQVQAQKALIAAQAQRDRLGDLARDVAFRLDQLNAREREAAQARLQSKLTFADIAILDKATPPISPSFPKPFLVIPVSIGAGLVLGILLALISEATDRRVRVAEDLVYATSAPLLGVIEASKRSGRSLGRRRLLLPAT
jgi:uncharacterized protein involved in exopolysaccharide biosynthesis